MHIFYVEIPLSQYYLNIVLDNKLKNWETLKSTRNDRFMQFFQRFFKNFRTNFFRKHIWLDVLASRICEVEEIMLLKVARQYIWARLNPDSLHSQ